VLVLGLRVRVRVGQRCLGYKKVRVQNVWKPLEVVMQLSSIAL